MGIIDSIKNTTQGALHSASGAIGDTLRDTGHVIATTSEKSQTTSTVCIRISN